MTRATFVGRTAELKLLESAYAARKSAFIPIYGRRRIGKSELILRFLRDKRALYYLGKTAPAELQMRELLTQAAVLLDEPLLAQMSTTDWKTVLTTIVDRHKGAGKIIIALDEFQWMVGASPELPSILQDLWDTTWKKSKRVVLILCGSYVGFMEREVLGRKSPLFGRRTAQIQLRPFGYRDAARFHPKWSRADQARAHFVCGGVPHYLVSFDESRSFEANIETNLLDEFAPLYREPDFLLREELRDVDNYYALLMAIANGHTTTAAIANASGVPERSIHYYVQQLVELGYVGRRHPVTGARPNQRNVRFVLDDALLRFWFRFVFPNTSFIQQMGARRAFRERIRGELPSYFGGCFERLCREALAHLYESEGVSASFEVGEYWDKHTQIDLVGARDDGWVDLGECKWGTVRSRAKIEAELTSKAARFSNPTGASIGLRVFAAKPPKGSSSDGIPWHGLDDLYA